MKKAISNIVKAVVQPGQKRKRDDELLLASVEQKDKQEPCLELVQVGHPSTSSGRGTMVTSNVVLYSCEELETLQMKMEHLFAQKSDVETVIELAEIQPGKKRKKEVELWLNRVEQMKTELVNIEAEHEEQGSCKKLKHHIVSMTREVEQLIQQGKFATGVVLDHHPVLEMVETSLVGSRSAENIEMILNWLKEDGVSAVGVHGMGGVGKTTLLKTIHNKLLQDSVIKGQVYWVTASRDCSLQKLQAAIGKCLGLGNIAEEDDERRKSLIFRRLCQLQSSVLIIDDMWNHFTTDKIGIPLESCKIVITTRSLEVCRKVGCQRVIKVVPLSREDAWSLFVEKSGVVPNKFVAIARGIVEQCAGLPLALITMGSCMRGVTDVHQWENTLFELKKPARRLDDDMEYEVFRILQFSYESLKEEMIKQCFLSCVLFPEDSLIRGKELIELWITEGFLDDIEGWENKVNKGHTILNRLESSSLLESFTFSWDKERRVKMHDLIRDMAMIISQNCVPCMSKARLQLNKVPEQKEWTIDLVKVSLSHNRIEEIPCGMSPETPKLRVLILSWNPLREIPESFFVHMKALQVLDLTLTDIERLPDTVSDLENLRGLFLQSCQYLRYVPSVAKLTKLMALNLDEVERLEEGVEGLGRLNCLEKLYYYSPWSIMDVPGLNNLILYGQLKVYRIVLGKNIIIHNNFIDDAITDYKVYEKEVMIFGRGETTIVLPSRIQSLIIKKSSLEGQRSLEEAFPSLRQATDLRKLELLDFEGLEYLFNSSSCPLRCLKLHNLANLIRIAKDRLYPSFSKLKILEIVECPKIRVVFQFTLPHQHGMILPNLESLTVESCDEMEEIIESNKGSSTGHIINATFPNLRKLELTKLPKLRSISSMRLHLCPSLQKIVIRKCPEIEGIFGDGTNLKSSSEVNPSVVLPHLRRLHLADLSKLVSILPLQLHLCPSLEVIEICRCPEIEGIFGDRTNLKNSSEVTPSVALPNLTLLHLKGLSKLVSVLPLQLHLCTSLKEIVIEDCPKLESICEGASEIFEPDHRVNPVNVRVLQLIPLKKLVIIDCPMIEGIFTDPSNEPELVFDLPSLRQLYLSGLPELKSLYSMRLHLCNSLQNLSIEECPKLKGIFRNLTGVTQPILDLPELEDLNLKGLPNLSSIYRGLLICGLFECSDIKIKKCPQLQLLSLSKNWLICDASPSTVASFPTETEDPEWWEPLHRQQHYPKHVVPLLSYYIHQARQGPPYSGLFYASSDNDTDEDEEN